MGKLNYAKLLKEIFVGYQELEKRASNSIADQKVNAVFVIDEVKGIFAWLDFGWTKQGRIETINVFVRLQEGRIHIEEDMTEEGIGTILLKKGVPPKDIVVEFHPPEMRQYTEFGVS
jgi:hypothetical protein